MTTRIKRTFASTVGILVVLAVLGAFAPPTETTSAATTPTPKQPFEMVVDKLDHMKANGASQKEIADFFDAAIMAGYFKRPISLLMYTECFTGMTYQEVRWNLGSYGTEMGSSGLTAMYQWVNPDGSKMTATFQDDRLVAKAQVGLK